MKLFQETKKVFIIGDVHGCLSELIKLLAIIDSKIAPDDEIIFVGDYVDRGPDSKGVVDLLIERQKNHPNKHVFIKGNHEDMLMTGDYWSMNGGAETLKSYGLDPLDFGISREFFKVHCPGPHVGFYKNLKHFYQVGNVVVVHAAIDPWYTLDEQSIHTMIWERQFDKYDGDYKGGFTVVRGHTPVNKVVETRNQIMIDTGCVFGYKMTCLIIDPENPADRSYIEVKSEQPEW